jgi:hypothetical protein
MKQVAWQVKMRRDSSPNQYETVIVYTRTRDEARKAALNKYAKQIGTFFGYCACEASKIKEVKNV